MKVAVITDLHFKFQEVLEKLRYGIFPDLVFSLGDIFGKAKKAPYPREFWLSRFSQFLETLGIDFYAIKGNHDQEWIEAFLKRKFGPSNLHLLENGRVHVMGGLNIAVLGGVYGERSFGRRTKDLPEGRRWKHYTREQVESLSHHRGVDLLLTHEWDDDIEEGLGRPEISEVCRVLKPKIHFAGHRHRHREKERAWGVCICLPRAGEMIFNLEFDEATGEIQRVAHSA